MVTTSCSSDTLSTPPYQQPARRTFHVPPQTTLNVPLQVTRPHSLRYHDNVDRCDDTFFSSLEMIPTRGLHMRTFSQSVSTRLLSSLRCYTSIQRRVSVSGIVRDSTRPECKCTPTNNREYPRPVSCHVPRCLNTNSDPLLHAPYCEYRPTTRLTRVAVHVIFHNDTAQSESNPHFP